MIVFFLIVLIVISFGGNFFDMSFVVRYFFGKPGDSLIIFVFEWRYPIMKFIDLFILDLYFFDILDTIVL